MLTLFREGGFPMWFLLAFGLAMLGFAARFAWAPTRRVLRIASALAVATGFTTLTGVCKALAMVGHHAPAYLTRHPELGAGHLGLGLAEVVLQGVAESLAPGILGFTLLSLAALLAAVGFHREVIE